VVNSSVTSRATPLIGCSQTTHGAFGSGAVVDSSSTGGSVGLGVGERVGGLAVGEEESVRESVGESVDVAVGERVWGLAVGEEGSVESVGEAVGEAVGGLGVG